MEHNPYSLESKIILVTGSSSEIGKAIAIECSKMGARLVLADCDAFAIKDLNSKLEGDGHLLFDYDLNDEKSLDKLMSQCPVLNGWCNACIYTKTLLLKFINSSSLSDLMAANIKMPVLLLQKIIKCKRIEKNSSVVFISSISGVYTVHYADSLNAISSGAISSFVKGAALDLSSLGIRVNSINISVIETEDLYRDSVLTESELDQKRNFFPLKRFGSPSDVALATVYMLSDASSWITGIHLPIDGGYTLL